MQKMAQVLGIVLLQIYGFSYSAIDNKRENVNCDDPQADEWLVDIHSGIRNHSQGELFEYAITKFGEPNSCSGRVTSEFDGRKYGNISFVWDSGESYSVTTMPIETSITKFESVGGFSDAVSVKNMVKRHTDKKGFKIDWSVVVEKTTTENGVVETFTGGHPGMNLHARLHYNKENKLTGAVISWAL